MQKLCSVLLAHLLDGVATMRLPVVKVIAFGILALSAYPMKTRIAVAAEEANPWRPSVVPAANADGFVLIRGGTFWSGDIVTRRDNPSLVRVEDFELLDHPVTNAEYKRFVDSTGHAPPLYWIRGSVPAGTESHPVVYVNRYDTDAYAAWRSRSEGRAYRLPTDAEFEYAARAGLDRKLYPWGNDDPSGRANYDSAGSRLYDTWRTHL